MDHSIQLTFRRHKDLISETFLNALEASQIPCVFNDLEGQLDWEDGKLTYFDKENSLNLDLIREYHSHQKKNYSLKAEPIAKALKLKTRDIVVDSTCGTGKDSMLLLSLGAHVEAYERNPLVFVLLLDAYERAINSNYKAEFINFSISFGNCLSSESESSKCYFDPMYKSSKKSKSLPRKEMQFFKDFIGEDIDQLEFLNSLKDKFALVVLKRPLKADMLASPHHSILGKTTRYDVFK